MGDNVSSRIEKNPTRTYHPNLPLLQLMKFLYLQLTIVSTIVSSSKLKTSPLGEASNHSMEEGIASGKGNGKDNFIFTPSKSSNYGSVTDNHCVINASTSASEGLSILLRQMENLSNFLSIKTSNKLKASLGSSSQVF